ncbi:MAG TPA: hypothetical protein P5572_09155 [Phycisphaerae bacterium]|nr:hypothetical protein [Phycisphaerales bacterium]HRX85172.1 hypothetical protein [Phycisphaerae bacterium]
MSAIPPDIAGAAAQAGFASSAASKSRDADRSAQAQRAAQQQAARVDKADSVEAEDLDTAVFADAEGAGSQGRAPDAEVGDDETQRPAESAADDGDTGHLDIQA